MFDILHLDGADVTRLSYLERRALLEQLRLDQAGPRIITPPVWSDIDGDIILDVMRQAALEGVVAKRATSPYQAGRRSRFWVKTPIRNAARLVVGGWIPASAREGAVGSLLVGGHDDATGDLVYCGHITSGFSNRARRTLYELLTQIGCTDPPSPISTRSATNRAPTGSTRSSSAASNTANTPDGYATPRGKASRPRTPRPRNCPSPMTIHDQVNTTTAMGKAAAPLVTARDPVPAGAVRRSSPCQVKVPAHAPDPRRRLASIHVVSRTLRGA